MGDDCRLFGLSDGECSAIDLRRECTGQPPRDKQCEVGLALSGGGIRSATFALGLVQAMAEKNSFGRIDVLSTVSGGGYVGAFVRSLFIPHERRFPGEGGLAEPKGIYLRRHKWALGVLNTAPSMRNQPPELAALDNAPVDPSAAGLPGSATRANPIWWLREHGRYLAPNGSGDYAYALAYVIRAWFALQFVVLISLLAIFLGFMLLAAVGFTWLAIHHPNAACLIDHVVNILSWRSFKLSPLLAIPILIWLVAIAPLAMAYWQSVLIAQWRLHEIRLAAILLLLAGLVAALWSIPDIAVVREAMGWGSWVGRAIGATILLGAVPLGWAFVRSAGSGLELARTELRRRLTSWMAVMMQCSAAFLFLGLVDSLALNIVRPSVEEAQSGIIAKIGIFGSIVPVIIWLTKKLQQWLPALQRLQNVATNTARALPGLLLLLGLAAYSTIAVACATIAYLVVWDQAVPWSVADSVSSPAFASGGIMLAITLAAAIVTGLSPNFLNISSLHLFYAGRLTRAYLGASNGRRLRSYNPDGEGGKAANIKEYDAGDLIDMKTYHDPHVLAPIHLINVTVNETEESGSQLVQRDRKGQNLCIGPDGVALGGRPISWQVLSETRAEQLPVGKWMAISGAAASSGMGSATSLGGALLTTFANIRLGYWWYAPLLGGRVKPGTGDTTFSFGGPFETQTYLLNEMTARYSRRNKLRLNLSDGGHFENSAALELIRRRLPIIIVSDAAADPLYDFGDIANLVHLARIELGAEIRPLTMSEMDDLPLNLQRHLGRPDSFRREQACDAIGAILFRIDYSDGTVPGIMLWIKPRVPADAPPDILTYSRQHPIFPQEPTVDQFFDAAQWENYRKLGNVIGEACLGEDALDALAKLRSTLP